MAKEQINFPVKDLKEINKILKNYFSEYVINDTKIIGLSNLKICKRTAALKEIPDGRMNNIFVQPNLLQAELNAIKVTISRCLIMKDRINFYNNGDNMVEPDYTLMKFEAFEPNFMDVYHDKFGDKVWGLLNTLDFKEIDLDNMKYLFDNEQIDIVNVDGVDVITTKQLFPLYDKCVSITATQVNIDDTSDLHYVVFACDFGILTVFTLVGVL